MNAKTEQNQQTVTLKCRLVSNAMKAKENSKRLVRKGPNAGKPDVGYTATLVLFPGEEVKLDKAVDAIYAATQWDKKYHRLYQNHANRIGDDPDMPSFGHRYLNIFKSTEAGSFRFVVREDGAVRELKEEEVKSYFYAGCNVIASVRPYAMNTDSPCITVALEALLYRTGGERMGSNFNAADEFEEFADEEMETDDVFN